MLVLVLMLAWSCAAAQAVDSLPSTGVTVHRGASIKPVRNARPPVYACYYTWYTTGYGPHGVWTHWGSSEPSLYAPKGTNPEHMIFPPHIRDISSCAYPLIGLYDSDDREVVRWHIRLAKAAGIDAFFVDWWGPGSWQMPAGLTHDAFVDVVLPVAAEEGFKVCLFDETAQFVEDFEEVKTWAADYLARFKDSPAYLRIEGKPVYAVYQVPFNPRMTPEQASDLRAYVEARVGPVYWVMDKIALGDNPLTGAQSFVIPQDWLELDWVDAYMGYGTFSVVRTHGYDNLLPMFQGMVCLAREKGRATVLPVHPGHNNSKLQTEPWVMPRRNGDTLREYLRAAEEADADAVLVTSFNEWPETTNIEPARTWDDPYLYLRILAEWKGKEFVPPEPPKRKSG